MTSLLPDIDVTRPLTSREGVPTTLSLPGPVYLPGVNMRNPITGRGWVYSNYAWSNDRPKVSPHHIKEHERSVFTNTNYNSSFYVIHPDWASEASFMRRIVSSERNSHSWDSRPAVQPLRETSRDTYLPILETRAANSLNGGKNIYKNMVNQLDRYSRYHQTTNRGMTPSGTQVTLPVMYPNPYQ